MAKNLILYDKYNKIINTTLDVIGTTGTITIENLTPETDYPEGEFYVGWEVNGKNLPKATVPEFTTLKQMREKVVIVYFSDLAEQQLVDIKGDSAYKIALDNGFIGSQEEWLKSLKGEQGEKGEKGDPGKNGVDITEGGSAYEIALAEGFEGTREEWLESLKGEKGDKGEQGDPGEDGFGVDGASAYEIALENGFIGNIQDFLDSLVGKPGRDGQDGNDGLSAYEIAVEKGYTGTEKEWLDSLKANIPDTNNWQKYKLTQDDGKPTFYTGIDPLTLPPGKYQISYMKKNPFNNSGSAMYNLDIMQGTDNTKQILAVLSYTGQVFIKNVHKGTDLGWKELTDTQTDTGWIPFQLINGALSNTAYKSTDENGFDCAYRTISKGNIVTKKLRINGSNLTPGQVMAQLPVNFAKNTQTFPVNTPDVTKNACVVIKPNGEVSFYVSNNDESWNEEGYAYAELTWHD